MKQKPKSELASRNYQITVENFGPIARAEVDLRPLTVFIGPSNTGKSYVATLIYALHQFFGKTSETTHWPRNRFQTRYIDFPALAQFQLDRNTSYQLESWLTDMLEGILPDGVRAPFPKTFFEEIRRVIEYPLFEKQLEREINHCFGVNRINSLVKRNHSNSRIELSVPFQGDLDNRTNYAFEFGRKKPKFTGTIPDIELNIDEEEVFYYLQARSFFWGQKSVRPFQFLLTNWLYCQLLQPLTCDAFYIPAARSDANYVIKILMSSLLHRTSDSEDISHRRSQGLMGTFGDFIDNLIWLDDKLVLDSSMATVADSMEDTILQGKIKIIRRTSNNAGITYTPLDWKMPLPIVRASSMVSQMSTIILHLRHVAMQGDMLIIEEPESNMHPAMQAVFARELVRLMRAGIHVVLTTHSDWFIEQLGNLVRLGMLTEAEQNKLGGRGYPIYSEEIGVWLFEHNNDLNGTWVREVTFDSETGLYSTDFDLVRERLYNESASIFNRNPDRFSSSDEEMNE